MLFTIKVILINLNSIDVDKTLSTRIATQLNRLTVVCSYYGHIPIAYLTTPTTSSQNRNSKIAPQYLTNHN